MGDQVANQSGLFLVQIAHDRSDLLEGGRRVSADWPRNDEGCPCFIDENGVHLIEDRVVVAGLYTLLQRAHHVVPQIVETKLVVGPVRDVRVIGGPSFGGTGLVEVDTVDGEAQEAIDRAHPFSVALGEV